MKRRTFVPFAAAALVVVLTCCCSRNVRRVKSGDDPWLTPSEAFEDQTAHTAKDGGAFVTGGLRIRDPRVISREEGYVPGRYCINNGTFVTLESGETIYERFEDGMMRRSVWAVRERDLVYLDESGCTTHDTYAFDGYKVGPDGTWDEKVPRLGEDLRPVSGVRYTEEGNPTGTYMQFTLSADGKGKMQRVIPSLGFTETFSVDPFGFSTYALIDVDDDLSRAHLCVLPGGGTLVLSRAGEVERYVLAR